MRRSGKFRPPVYSRSQNSTPNRALMLSTQSLFNMLSKTVKGDHHKRIKLFNHMEGCHTLMEWQAIVAMSIACISIVIGIAK